MKSKSPIAKVLIGIVVIQSLFIGYLVWANYLNLRFLDEISNISKEKGDSLVDNHYLTNRIKKNFDSVTYGIEYSNSSIDRKAVNYVAKIGEWTVIIKVPYKCYVAGNWDAPNQKSPPECFHLVRASASVDIASRRSDGRKLIKHTNNQTIDPTKLWDYIVDQSGGDITTIFQE